MLEKYLVLNLEAEDFLVNVDYLSFWCFTRKVGICVEC